MSKYRSVDVEVSSSADGQRVWVKVSCEDFRGQFDLSPDQATQFSEELMEAADLCKEVH